MGPPHPASSSRESRLSCSSTATRPPSDHRKALHRKENQFVYRNGSKFHAYDRDKAPYPNSFDKDYMELQCIDNAILFASKRAQSFVDFPDDNFPKRVLDLGTGLGIWPIAAAKLWKDTTFVGIDMVNVQVPIAVLEPDIADRIEWVYSNFLRNKLPFDDEEFDYVHVQRIALGIPENKWYALYEEIHRVMKPGAIIEHVEEDAMFPILPRWYTDPLRAHSRGLSMVNPGDAQQRHSFPQGTDTSQLAHEHELLESLFEEVWSSRFINPNPVSILPGYFGACFQRVVSSPIVQLEGPPYVPLAPFPGAKEDTPLPSLPSVRRDPRSEAVEATLSSLAFHSSIEKQSLSTSSSVTSFSPDSTVMMAVTLSRQDSEASSTLSTTSQANSSSSGSGSASSKAGRRPSAVIISAGEEVVVGGEKAYSMLPIDTMNEEYSHSTNMNCHHIVTCVLSVKEAMWDELMIRVHRHAECLRRFGWRDEDYNEPASRAKFDFAISQFQSDMRMRTSLWTCAANMGWKMPARDAPSKAEILEEIQLRQEIMEAQVLHAAESDDEPDVTCRRLRVLTGAKEM